MVTAFGLGEFTFFADLDGLARDLRIRENLEGKGRSLAWPPAYADETMGGHTAGPGAIGDRASVA